MTNRLRRRSRLSFTIWLLVFLCASGIAFGRDFLIPTGPLFKKVLPTIPLTIDDHEFTVEVAEKLYDLRQGLMNRKHLSPDRGMLFIYPYEQPVSVWMKNTYLSLDILFLDKNKRIVHIHPAAEPHSERKITTPHAILYFIELLGGTCKRLKITTKSKVYFER